MPVGCIMVRPLQTFELAEIRMSITKESFSKSNSFRIAPEFKIAIKHLWIKIEYE